MFPFPSEAYFRLQKEGGLPERIFRATRQQNGAASSHSATIVVPDGFDLILDCVGLYAEGGGGQTVDQYDVYIQLNGRPTYIARGTPGTAIFYGDRQFNGMYIISGAWLRFDAYFSAAVLNNAIEASWFGILVKAAGIGDHYTTA